MGNKPKLRLIVKESSASSGRKPPKEFEDYKKQDLGSQKFMQKKHGILVDIRV